MSIYFRFKALESADIARRVADTEQNPRRVVLLVKTAVESENRRIRGLLCGSCERVTYQ